MPGLLVRLRVAASVFAMASLLLASGPARGQAEPPVDVPPRDVGIVVQPAAANLPPLPSDFQRIDSRWLTLEFPGSVRDRAESLAREAEPFRARLAADLGQPVLDHVLVRIARSPDQMAALAPEAAPPPPYAAGVA